MIQQAAFLLLDMDVVHHVLPGKQIPLRLDVRVLRLLAAVVHLAHDRGRIAGPLLVPALALLLGVQVGGHVAAGEDEGLGGAGDGRVELDGGEVDDHEADEEADEDAEVAPHVRVAVVVRRLHVGVAADRRASRHGARAGADERVADEGGVGGEELRAGELAAVELVGDQDLEAVVDGVQPADPAEPGVHLRDGDAVDVLAPDRFMWLGIGKGLRLTCNQCT